MKRKDRFARLDAQTQADIKTLVDLARKHGAESAIVDAEFNRLADERGWSGVDSACVAMIVMTTVQEQ